MTVVSVFYNSSLKLGFLRKLVSIFLPLFLNFQKPLVGSFSLHKSNTRNHYSHNRDYEGCESGVGIIPKPIDDLSH